MVGCRGWGPGERSAGDPAFEVTGLLLVTETKGEDVSSARW